MPNKNQEKPAPDFNFPKDVLEQADREMQAAAAKSDSQDFLRALLSGLKAMREIEPDNIGAQLDYLHMHGKNIHLTTPEQALKLAIEARLLDGYYSNHRWQIRGREVPADSVAAWSSEQFTDTINALYERAGEMAANVKVEEFIPTVLTPGDTLIFNDFRSLFHSWSNSDKPFSQFCQLGSAAYFYWLAKELPQYHNLNKTLEEYEKNKQYEWAGLLLIKIFQNRACRAGVVTPNNTYDLARERLVQDVNEAIATHPKFPYNNYLKECVERLTAPSIRVKMRRFVPVKETFAFDVQTYNAKSVKLEFCKISKTDLSNKEIASLSPAVTFDYEPDSLYDNHTVEASVPGPGLYAVRIKLNGNKDFNVFNIEATPIIPIVTYYKNEAVAIVTDFKTGAAVSGVEVMGARAIINRVLGRTNSDGVLRFGKWNNGGSFNHALEFSYQGNKYNFDDDISLYFSDEKPTETAYSINVLSDRALYHPGEVVSWVVVGGQKDVSQNKSPLGKTNINVLLRDANGKNIASKEVTTDAMGRADGTFTLPADGLTGTFSLIASYGNRTGACRIRVSDFKAPVFEVVIDSLKMSKTEVTIKGVATTLSGMPVADSQARLTIKTGWYGSSDILYDKIVKTNSLGRFEFEVESDSVTDQDDYDLFKAEVSVTSAAAEVATASKLFRFDVPYNFSFGNLKDKYSTDEPFKFNVQAKDVNNDFGKIDYTWELITTRSHEVVRSGKAQAGSEVVVDVSDLPAQEYYLAVEPEDEELAEDEVSDNFYFYSIAKNQVPATSALFLLREELSASTDSKSVRVQVGTAEDKAFAFAVINSKDGIAAVRKYNLSKGFNNITLPLFGTEDVNVNLYLQKDGSICQRSIEIRRVEPQNIKISVESFRDKLTPGQEEVWRMRIEGPDAASAAAVATMYNRALDLLSPYGQRLNFYFPSASLYMRTVLPYDYVRSTDYSLPVNSKARAPRFDVPEFVYLFGSRNVERKMKSYTGSAGRVAGMAVISAEADDVEESMVLNEVVEYEPGVAYGEQKMMKTGAVITTGEEAMPEVEMREAEVLQAFWMPRLLADDEGVVAIEFTVPNANTTWAFHMFGWTSDALAANFNATALASKPVMVQSAVPRFLRQGDSATLRATVFNNTDSSTTATTEFQIFNPADGAIISTVRNTVQLSPKGSAIIEAPVTAAPEMASVGYRIKAASGTYTDGEQDIIPILASSQILVESKEFYLDANGEPVTLKVPAAKDAKTTLQYCQNPVWTIVKAMRGVQWNDFSMTGAITTQLGSALMAQHIVSSNPRIASVLAQWQANPDQQALTSMLEKNEDLKTLLLNQTPWVQAAENNTDRMGALSQALDSARCDYVIVQSLKALQELQNSDGGFRWAKWSDEQSSVWVTVSALQDLGIVNSFGKLPAELSPVVNRAFRFVEKNALDDKKATWLHEQYALIATQFPDIAPSEAGEHLINKTCVSLKGQWRKMNLSDKAYTALILNAHGFADEARLIVSSIEQYGKYVPGRGLEFPSVKDMRSYGNIIQAVAMVTPGNPVLNQLRQWVILQAQATDDLGACNPDYIISSVLLTGTVWSDMTSVQPITIDGAPAMFAQAELGTGYFAEKVAPGSVIQIAPNGVTPSYGSIVSVFNAPMKNVPAFKSDDLEITKRLMVQRNGQWVESDTFESGEEVRVQLLITAKRQLEYVAITDQRPAGLEPRDQLPGWVWSNGICFYRENRDASTRLFISYLPKGSYSLTYAMTAATPGTFASGVATLQSQYDPALTAHSAGAIIQIK